MLRSRGETVMIDRTRYRGSMTALVTPFDGKGAFDEKAFRGFVDWQIDNGTTCVVPTGTTGESATLSHAEHRRVIEVCIDQTGGRVPVMAGAGSNNTIEAVALAKHGEEAGADSLLVVSPYYNKPNQRGLYEHYAAVARAVSIPIFVYNIPGRSVVDISPDTMGRLAHDFDNIIGVKDAVGDMARVSRQRITCGQDFVQLSAEDATSLGYNAHGGVGAVSVTANVAPKLSADFQNAMLAGDYATALSYQDRLMPLHIALFIEPGVAGTKYALSKLGHCENILRSPIMPIEASTAAAIDNAMRHADLLN